jgi:hypothetical protein
MEIRWRHSWQSWRKTDLVGRWSRCESAPVCTEGESAPVVGVRSRMQLGVKPALTVGLTF